MLSDGNLLDLFDKPTIQKGESVISGELISIHLQNHQIEFIDVLDSAHADFKEPIDSSSEFYNQSILSGNRIKLFFKNGLMDNILCYGQAYSWYFPSALGKNEYQENTVSGDTIKFIIQNDELQTIHVIGGSQGQYMSGKSQVVDSNVVMVIDTIEYRSNYIEYALTDSLISLKEKAYVKSGAVALDAHLIDFATDKKIIEAFSADITADTIVNPYYLSEQIQPNIIPVLLKDGDEEIFGNYLLYSIETEKGRIIQTKTDFTEGMYYGKKLYREQKDIYYVKEGRFTTCDADEPHFHFKSSNMKMIEGKRLIAKPVVFYIESIPLLKLPFYIFPLEKGRHSGLLPFSFGKFERGERYVKNVGYYWAASDFIDFKTAFDYYEDRRTLNINQRINFKKRYVLNGDIDGNYARTTSYNSEFGQEVSEPRWTINGNYSHIFSPDFNIRANGSFQSDSRYQSDFSQNLEELTNRSLRSQISFSKRFSKTVSLTGSMSHTVNLDLESRDDLLPSLALSLPAFYPFGAGKRNNEGKMEYKFYNSIYLRYNPSLRHTSNRSTIAEVVDTTFIIDTISLDTTFIIDSTDSYRTRKRYAVMTHQPSLALPQLRFGHFLHLTPSLNYSETWVKVYETDQSIDAAIDASKIYRSYSYSANVSANTELYGAIYPNMFGLIGLRHVITPSASFSYSPQIENADPEVRTFTGSGLSSSRRRFLSFNLRNLLQAKVKSGEQEKNVDVVLFKSSFTYDLENDTRPLSDLISSFSSSALPIISGFSGSMKHSFYNPTDSTEHFWSPFLESFSVSASFHLAGNKFFFDDMYESTQDSKSPKGKKTKEELTKNNQASSGWSFSANYSYRESGFNSTWTKSSFINFTLNFKLTPSTAISYRQNYNIARKLTSSNSVNVTRKIHCWTGSMYWVPIGTNRGFGFKLSVTDLPEIKLDNNHDSFTTQSLNR